ncbi:hypothetical protein Taro_037704 [Colocasia esculenta]|uniref:Uncharacterized protein n=1 Tax=Colocasia esculenta TaxID=4460 RepID=A0A843W1B6_COLES|nr:hypothetical protein [Colocasia esculenta]
MGRAPCCDKANVKKGPWSPEEDAKLKAYIEEHGTGGNWIALPQKIGLKRCGKSCRLRWLNYLRPNIKHGGFSEEEDNIICSLYISIGSRWSIIAAQLPGRTDNDIKNYWNTRLKKKLLGRRKEAQNRGFSPSNIEESKNFANGMNCEGSSQGLSASAIERLQLHMQLGRPHNSFSFFNNLWPKFHPLGDRILQGQQNGAISADAGLVTVQQNPDATAAALEPSQRATIFTHNPNQLPPCMASNNINLGDPDQITSPLNGFSSSSSSMAFSIEQPNESFNSGLQLAELNDLLLYGKSGCFDGNATDQPPRDLDCFREMGGIKEGAVCWPEDCFGEKSSASSWGIGQTDTMFDEGYMFGYDS